MLVRVESAEIPVELECVSGVLKRTLRDIEEANALNTDILKGVYEGGFKTWECSIDMLKYLQTSQLSGKVIELGCGSALPGIYCQMTGCTVDYQDYNEQVLRNVTAVNLAANLQKLDSGRTELVVRTNGARFYAGDWSELQDEIGDRYDAILTCETIYEAANHDSLLDLMRKILKPGGFVLLAAKYSYFGCTGSMVSFKQACERACKCTWETLQVLQKSVRREIVRITFLEQ